jgi:tetratricopeptide (TPR) repeat protein
MGKPFDDALSSKAESLANAGDWAALYELLRGEEQAGLLADGSTAYRFAESLYHTGRMEELASYAAAYEEAARGAADPDGVMRALNLAGIAAFELGDPEGARSKFDALMELAEASHDEDMLARSANNLGAIANLRGRRHEALAYYHLAIPLYQRLGQPRGIAQTYHNLGLSYHDMGRFEESVAAYSRAVVVAEELGYQPQVAMSTVGRAEAELRRGDVLLSRQLAERGLELARSAHDPISEAEALRVRGLVRAAGGEGQAGLADLEAARKLARDARHTLLEAEIERDIGLQRLVAGQASEARENLDAALTLFESLGARAEARAVRQKSESIEG